jgi:hypothetical protein
MLVDRRPAAVIPCLLYSSSSCTASYDEPAVAGSVYRVLLPAHIVCFCYIEFDYNFTQNVFCVICACFSILTISESPFLSLQVYHQPQNRLINIINYR